MRIKKNKNFFINLDDALLNNFKFVVILRFDNGQLLNSNQIDNLENKILQATNSIWAEVQKSLQKTLSKPSFETWIRPAKFNCFENGLLTLIAPNTFSSDWLRKNYCQTIEKAAKEICGHDVKVVFKSETNISSDSTNKENLDEQLSLIHI